MSLAEEYAIDARMRDPPEMYVAWIPLLPPNPIPFPIFEQNPFVFISPVVDETFDIGYYIPASVRQKYGIKFWAGFGIACWLHPIDVEFDPLTPSKNAIGEWTVFQQTPAPPDGVYGIAKTGILVWGEKRTYKGAVQGHALYYNGAFSPITGFFKLLGIAVKA